ncbi:polysaccharide deacetylase family protein [Polyangium aurulentum]|uniref:polysaccharide deacetylase family protein n=1 Tax=Polyangium aurulentum TaxID=2567896 RepID=UPI00146BC9A8|nr:polysaccharide deacetylase family protein [Polyangium aurulentum]UQA58613.1 polysaccharide deacetylase family protein [Polyangium aurulentum]
MDRTSRRAILCFHRVLPASRRTGPDEPYFMRQTALELERFCWLLDELERRDAILPPESLFDWTSGAGLQSRPGVILTFDDGYADVLEFAAPALKERGMRALLCVTTAVASGAQQGFPVDHWYATVQAAAARTGFLDGFTDEAWAFDLARAEDRARLVNGPEKRAFVRASPEDQQDMLDRLRRALRVDAPVSIPPLLGVSELVSLTREGFMLGAHGERHALLPLLSEVEAAGELARSRAFFPAHRLPETSILAHPDGATCPRTEALAQAAGYTIGLGLGSRFATRDDPPLHLPRLIPTNDPSWFERRLLPLFTAEGR